MTDLNRRAGALGEYGDEPNDNGTPPDPEADDAESPESDGEDAPDPSTPDAPAVAPAVQGGTSA